MIFSSDYSLKMPIGQAVMTAIIGIVTVLAVLAVISVLIMLVSKVIRLVEGKTKAVEAAPKAEDENPTLPRPTVDLVGVDEPTAAVIMAIVSNQSGIPIERLRFKSIKLLEDEQ